MFYQVSAENHLQLQSDPQNNSVSPGKGHFRRGNPLCWLVFDSVGFLPFHMPLWKGCRKKQQIAPEVEDEAGRAADEGGAGVEEV